MFCVRRGVDPDGTCAEGMSHGARALQFGDGSFDVAFDKGGLDALMGDEGEGADTAGVLRS